MSAPRKSPITDSRKGASSSCDAALFSSDSYGQAVLCLARQYQAYLDACVSPYGISSAHVPLLMYLWEGKSGDTQNDIARALGVDKGTISRNVQALVRLGLVDQTSSSRDSRACTVTLTKKGRGLAAPVTKITAGWNEGVCAQLTDDDRDRVMAGLNQMAEQADALLGDARLGGPVPAIGARAGVSAAAQAGPGTAS
jgi:DNA-binding MarR family transcriptional regulator